MKLLRDVLPSEFFDSFCNDPAGKHLDRVVLETFEHGYWPGKHKYVMNWWALDNGYAMGWNENPSVGWSFPTVLLRKKTRSI